MAASSDVGVFGRQRSESTADGSANAQANSQGRLVHRNARPLQGEGRNSGCRCNILATIVIGLAAIFLYRWFSAPSISGILVGETLRNMNGQGHGQALGERGELRRQPGMAERGGLRDGVRVPDQYAQQPMQGQMYGQMPQRGELRNDVRNPQPGVHDRGNLRDRP